MQIRHERPADAAAIAGVHRAAFGDHGEVVAGLVGDLRRLNGLALVAEERGDVVGHVMFSPGWVDAPARLVDVHILSPVGVQPTAQRRGIATALIRRGLEILTDRRVPLVFLEGDPSFYGRLGFAPGADQGFRKPSLRIPDRAFQVIALPAHEPWMKGALVYPDAFWRHDTVGLRESHEEAPGSGGDGALQARDRPG